MGTGHLIRIHPDAPAKPPAGAPCNGCGVCCLLEPCPLGVLLSGRRRGACAAVQCDGPARRYRCGAITVPHEVLASRLPGWLSGPGSIAARLLPGLASRWIGAGQGCDSSLQIQAADAASQALIGTRSDA